MSPEIPTYDDNAAETPRELWNHDAFVTYYNQEADQIGGWPYISDEGTPNLQRNYERSNFKTVKDFAEFMFRYEQVEADDVASKFKAYKPPAR